MNKYIEELKNLYKLSFDDSDAYVEHFFSTQVNAKNTVFVPEGEKVASALYLIDRKLFICGKKFFAPFVVAAATLPEYRRQGKMEKVMALAFEKLRAKGVGFTALYPSVKSYYERFGFTTFTFTNKQKIAFDGQTAQELTVKRGQLKKIYNETMKKYNCFSLRNKKSFSDIQKRLKPDNGQIRVFQHEDKLCYVICEDGALSEVCGDLQVLFSVNEFDGKEYEVFGGKTPHGMIRLISPVNVLRQIVFDKDGEVCFYLQDEFLPNNCGIYNIVIKNKKAKVEYCAANKVDVLPCLSIEELTQSICGIKIHKTFVGFIAEKENLCFDKY